MSGWIHFSTVPKRSGLPCLVSGRFGLVREKALMFKKMSSSISGLIHDSVFDAGIRNLVIGHRLSSSMRKGEVYRQPSPQTCSSPQGGTNSCTTEKQNGIVESLTAALTLITELYQNGFNLKVMEETSKQKEQADVANQEPGRQASSGTLLVDPPEITLQGGKPKTANNQGKTPHGGGTKKVSTMAQSMVED